MCEKIVAARFYPSQWAALTMAVLMASGASGQQCQTAITLQPPSNVTLTQGAAFLLYPTVTSSCSRVGFQWRYDGFNLSVPLAHSNAFGFLNAQPGLAGVYDLVVTDISGNSLTSNPCLLLVRPQLKAVSSSNQNFGFSFDTNTGRTNTVECTTSLGTNALPGWTSVWTRIGDGSTARFSVTNPAASPGRAFYRVRVE